MDMKGLYQRLQTFIKKYKYVALVLVLGILLMTFPTGKQNTQAGTNASNQQVRIETLVSTQMEALLSKVSGAGKVSVMLTVAAGEETIYQTNDDKDTVTITDADRNQNGLIRQVNPPSYLGAVIVCQGADDPSVRLAIVNAVSKVTGLGTDRIAVLKMK